MKIKITHAFMVAFLLVITKVGFAQQTYVHNGHEYKSSDKVKEFTKAEEIAHFANYQDKSTTCAGAANSGAVVLQDCGDVGTAAFYTQGLNVNLTNVGGCTVPGVAESCAGAAGYTTAGRWIQVNPDPGVNIVDIQVTTGAVAAGNHSSFIQFFQGSCASLTAIGCSEFLLVTMGLRIPINVHQEGINPAQNLWMYIWNDSGKAFNVNVEVIGSSSTTITNDNCATPSTSMDGCNLGANADNSWTGPSNNGKVCTGGTWYSNENTVYFQFTASATTGSIGVTGITCNEGTAGQAQFGVWNSCACVGTYTVACFKSCAVGTGTLSLAALTPGATYIIVVDGQAGDICEWSFTTTGIILPVEMLSITGKAGPTGNLIEWTTASERDCESFSIQRSPDGVNFTTVGVVAGSGTTTAPTDYSFLDKDYPSGLNYYRLVQRDINGKEEAFAPLAIDNNENGIKVSPNPVTDEATVTYGSKTNGETTMKILDLSGKVIQTEQLISYKGVNEYQFITSDLSTGMYLLLIETANESKTVKFTK